MNLSLDYRWEHALLAETVAKASEKDLGYLGRTAVQKLIYFMQVLGVPMQYRFEIYHYGPFCSSILQDVDWLMADEVIKDTSTEDRYSRYVPGDVCDDLRNNFSQRLSEYHNPIESVVEVLGGLDSNTLELIATLHFCFRWVKASGGDGPWKTRTIDKFKATKKDKFPDNTIDEWYRSLLAANLVEE